MGRLRRAALALLGVLLLGWVALGVSGAQVEEAESPGELLSAIEEAAEFERGEERERLVEIAQEGGSQRAAAIVEALIRQVEDRAQAGDPNYIGHCVLALEQLRAQEATEALLDVLQDPYPPLSYLATRALGTIYQGRGGTAEQAQDVNLALLAVAYGGAPDPLPYAAAIALCRVNGITGAEAPESFTRAALRQRLDEWVAAGNQLPQLSQMPWPVVLHVAITGNPEPRRNAIQILRQRRELEPVGRIVTLLQEESLDAGTKEALGALLGELTAVPYPPNSAVDTGPAELVAEWRQRWHRRLSQQSDPQHVTYAWRQLELAVADYVAHPNDEKSRVVRGLRSVLLEQLSGPEEIPPHATAETRALLEPPLRSKLAIGDAVAALRRGDATEFERSEALQSIQRELVKEHGMEVGRLFLEPLAQIAAQEQNRMFAADLGSLLWELTGIPLDLDETALETRQQRLLQWASTLESREGISIQLQM